MGLGARRTDPHRLLRVELQKQILRAAYRVNADAHIAPQACGAQDDTGCCGAARCGFTGLVRLSGLRLDRMNPSSDSRSTLSL